MNNGVIFYTVLLFQYFRLKKKTMFFNVINALFLKQTRGKFDQKNEYMFPSKYDTNTCH